MLRCLLHRTFVPFQQASWEVHRQCTARGMPWALLLAAAFLPRPRACSADEQASVNYIQVPRDGSKVFLAMEPGIAAGAASPAQYAAQAVPLRDARRAPPRLGQEAAQLLRAATRLLPEDFYDSGRVVAEYYQEVRDAIQDATGAVEVIVFHHIVRNEALQASPGLDNRGAGVGGYARNAHADYTARTAVGAARQSLSRITDPEVRSRCQKCRFVLVNAWRNISDLPVQQHPLAVLDAQTLKEEDLVTVELRYATFSSESLQLRPAPRHRWLYAPGMEKDELLLFKQYDSDPTQPQHAFHCALDVAVPGSPARESIEVRAVAFFAPSATSVCLEDLAPCQPTAAEVAAAILTALACAQDWPAETRKEVCRHLAMDEKGAAEGLMVAMVASNADAENPAASMPGAPAWLQEEVKACLRAAGFCEKMKSSFLKP
ncbi:unnamed protein product [Effrenium voratum]|nr:unnamed protein product [Effrenium voratum]